MAHGFMGAGDLFVSEFDDNGQPKAYKILGNITLSIQPNGKLIPRVSTSAKTYGQVLDTFSVVEPSKLTITSDEISLVNLGLALQGIVETIAAAAGDEQETFTVAIGDMVELAHQDVSNVVITGGHVEDRDYRVFAGVGMIEILPNGNITDGASISVAYDYGTKAGYRILGSSKASIIAALKLDGVNKITGESVVVVIDKAVLQNKKDVVFVGRDQKFVELQLEGQMETLPGKKEPFTVTVRG
ncbi:MAG: hypothetical protein PHP00_06885 [Thiotrichaceae bacterium]|nr:hypothetical protein [Thiotrichaceae bacterium]